MLIYDEMIEDDLDEALKFSADLERDAGLPRNDALDKQMDYLSLWGNHDEPNNVITFLYHDFAPYSFGFTHFRPALPGKGLTIEDYPARLYPEFVGKVAWINGGLIYHGDHDRGGDGGAPTLSVNLTPVSGWSVHT
jgi:hypothetical protein